MPAERVAVLGASNNPDRFAYQATTMLAEHGHEPIPVHPTLPDVDGRTVVPDLASIEGKVETLTLYVNPTISAAIASEIVALNPDRVIFNPGTESPELQTKLDAADIPWQEDCTLVLLRAGQF